MTGTAPPSDPTRGAQSHTLGKTGVARRTHNRQGRSDSKRQQDASGKTDQNSRSLKTRVKRPRTTQVPETQRALKTNYPFKITSREARKAKGKTRPPTGTSRTGSVKPRNPVRKRNKRGLRKKKRANTQTLKSEQARFSAKRPIETPDTSNRTMHVEGAER